jgi:hypothetical protein
MASLFFISEPLGGLVAFLGITGMALNIPVIIHDRGFSKLMSIPHLIPWTSLVGLILFARPDNTGVYDYYLTALLVINAISLLFDYPDSVKWLKGDINVAGRS